MSSTTSTGDSLDSLLQHLQLAEVPADVQSRARCLFLDTVGCALAGLQAPAVRAFAQGAAEVDAGSVALPTVTADGGNGPLRLSATAASMTLAMAACWDEACEGLALAHGRPGVPVVAAVLAVGLARGRSLGEAWSALITGYEVGGRLGAQLRIKPGMHVDAGWPALGSAAAVARLLGLDPQGQRDAVELTACQLPFGLYLPITQGADGRNTYLGHAASLGVQAALAARAGVKAPRGALSKHAELALGLSPTQLESSAVPETQWLLRDGYLKRWPAVKHVHYGIAAARALRQGLPPMDLATHHSWLDGLQRIVLRTYPEAVTYCGNRAPAAPITAQFSLSFGLAAALCHSDLGPQAYREPAFHDARLRRLEALIELVPEADLGAGGRRAVVLQVVDARGVRLAHALESVEGDPSQPLGPDAVHDKFMRMASPSLGESLAKQMAQQALHGVSDRPLRDWWQPGA